MAMRIAMLSPISWITPPEHYGPWESVVSVLTEQLISLGVDVTLFATGDSQTRGRLEWICKRALSEDMSLDPKVWECLHIANLFEQASQFDLIHNHYDFLPLSYSGMIDTPLLTTIHGFSSDAILPVYKKYNDKTNYVAISEADKRPELDYLSTVYHGIEVEKFPFVPASDGYLLFFGRIHHDKGVFEAINAARQVGKKLIIAGIIQDREYFSEKVEPYLDHDKVEYIGPIGADKKAEVLGRAEALLHLINFDEPFGLSMVEAMASGTPVIAINRGSIAEIIKNGKTGFIIDRAEEAGAAIRRLTSIDRYDCRRHVKGRFSAVQMAQKYISVYREVLAQ